MAEQPVNPNSADVANGTPATPPIALHDPTPATWPLEARRQIDALERRLAAETYRREEANAQLVRLLRETTDGSAPSVAAAAEERLRLDLAVARREIAQLQAVLANERAEYDALAQRFSAVQEQLERTVAPPGTASEEIAALTERQRRALAEVQRELDASRARADELQAAVEHARTSERPLADEVAALRGENRALQQQLDEQRQHNRALSAKLQMAGRVTDLIFRMRAGAATSTPPAGP